MRAKLQCNHVCICKMLLQTHSKDSHNLSPPTSNHSGICANLNRLLARDL